MPTPTVGQYKCILHKDDPNRAEYNKLGFIVCKNLIFHLHQKWRTTHVTVTNKSGDRSKKRNSASVTSAGQRLRNCNLNDFLQISLLPLSLLLGHSQPQSQKLRMQLNSQRVLVAIGQMTIPLWHHGECLSTTTTKRNTRAKCPS